MFKTMLCVDISIFFGAYINKYQNGIGFYTNICLKMVWF